MAKAPKPGTQGKKTKILLSGSANGPLNVEVRITDPEYLIDALSDDIRFQRVWFEGKADTQGWVKLVYSADGPEGNPWQVGNIRFVFDPQQIDSHFRNVANFSVKLVKE